MTAQTAGDVGGLADRSRPGFYDHKTDFAGLSNAELCERLRGVPGSQPYPFQDEAARRISQLSASYWASVFWNGTH